MSEKTTEQHKAELAEAEEWGRNLRPSPGPRKGKEGLEQKKRAAVAAKKQSITIRFDADIIERFKALAGEDGSYQRLLNQAAREWLDGHEMEDTLRRVIGEVLDARDAKKSA